jgi:hypothetical protein
VEDAGQHSRVGAAEEDEQAAERGQDRPQAALDDGGDLGRPDQRVQESSAQAGGAGPRES